jgi:4-amino-4-deoxy-L-arabinose transferase-like glycosyltransferase
VLLLVAALALAALGQLYFQRGEYLWDGLIFYGLAALCFVLAWRVATAHLRVARPARRPMVRAGDWLRERPIPAALLALGLFLSGVATLLSRGRAWNTSTYDVVVLWALGVAAVIIAAFWPSAALPRPSWDHEVPRRAALRVSARLHRVGRGNWLELATVVGLTVLALLLRVTALDSVPFTLGGDEAWFGLTARQVLQGEFRNPFVTAFVSMPTLFYWPLSWAMRLLGDNMVGLRLPAALVGTATVPVLYLFARHMWGRRMAFLSAAFLATYDYHIHYSRLGANNVWDPFFAVLALWLLDWALTESDAIKRDRLFILTGLVVGLSAYFYTGARLLPYLVIIYLAFVLVQKRWSHTSPIRTEHLVRCLFLLVLAFLVVAGPILSYALAHADDWNARINQVGILQSGWLAREPGLTGKTTFQVLAEQFLRAAGAFHVYPDRTVWYGADRPLLGFLPGVFAVLGMAWALLRWRDRRYFLVLAWFWSVIIAGGMLTESPPSSQRLVLAIPAVALLVATGLDQTVRLGRWLFDLDRRWGNVLLGLLVLGIAVGSVRYYFVEFTTSRRYGSANGETATMIGHYLSDLDGDDHGYRAYFLGSPRIYWNFGTIPFLAPEVPGQDVIDPLVAPPDLEDSESGSVFLFLPERVAELDFVQQAYPGGRLQEFHDTRGSLRFAAYVVPP